MDSYHQQSRTESKIKFEPGQAAKEAAKMLGQLHATGLRGQAVMFQEEFDRIGESIGSDIVSESVEEPRHFVADVNDFDADLSRGISLGIAKSLQNDAELQLRNRIRETIAGIKNDPKAIDNIKKQITGLKKDKVV